jgi:hypothetical protein
MSRVSFLNESSQNSELKISDATSLKLKKNLSPLNPY